MNGIIVRKLGKVKKVIPIIQLVIDETTKLPFDYPSFDHSSMKVYSKFGGAQVGIAKI